MLPTIWFILWGLLWAVFFMTDGYDLGLGSLHPVVARTDRERHRVLSTMAPFWDPNQVWIIAAGGMTFAVFPAVYATLFSSLYAVFMLILFGLILRAVSFEFRNQSPRASWRSGWDLGLAAGSLVPTVLLGVFFANLFRGIPIDGDGYLQGGLLGLFNGYGLLGGLLFFVLFGLHGLAWLAVKTDGVLHDRAIAWAKAFWAVLVVVLAGFLVASAFATGLYGNYLRYPILMILPGLAVVALVLVRVFLARRAEWKAFFASSVLIFFVMSFALAGLYPNLVPSSLDPAFSLTIHNAASSYYTLVVMLVISGVFLPIVILYQSWAHYLFRDKIGSEAEY